MSSFSFNKIIDILAITKRYYSYDKTSVLIWTIQLINLSNLNVIWWELKPNILTKNMNLIELKQSLIDKYLFSDFLNWLVDRMYFMDYYRVEELEYTLTVKDIDDEENTQCDIVNFQKTIEDLQEQVTKERQRLVSVHTK